MSQTGGEIERRSGTRGRRELRAGRVFGIDVYLDFSVLIVFTLVVAVLAISVFPGWHPDWSVWLNWSSGLAAGVLFFASLLAHELAHSVVARRFGLPVPRITLFLFGGVSEMEDEPDSPKVELAVAIVGPLTSLCLGLLFGTLGFIAAGGEFRAAVTEDPHQAVQALAPLPTLLLWLGPINLLLAVFNMLPGFPLDGGRVFRAVAWWMTGDHLKATRWASGAGRLFGWAILAVGVVQVASGALVGGLWLILIGWFLATSASASYRQTLLHRALDGLSAQQLMRTEFASVRPDMPLPRFIDECLMQSSQVIWPVVDDDGDLVGYLGLDQVKPLTEKQRDARTVADVMNRRTEEVSLQPTRSAKRVLRDLTRIETPYLVVAGDRVVGLVSQAELMKWLALHRYG